MKSTSRRSVRSVSSKINNSTALTSSQLGQSFDLKNQAPLGGYATNSQLMNPYRSHNSQSSLQNSVPAQKKTLASLDQSYMDGEVNTTQSSALYKSFQPLYFQTGTNFAPIRTIDEKDSDESQYWQSPDKQPLNI